MALSVVVNRQGRRSVLIVVTSSGVARSCSVVDVVVDTVVDVVVGPPANWRARRRVFSGLVLYVGSGFVDMERCGVACRRGVRRTKRRGVANIVKS